MVREAEANLEALERPTHKVILDSGADCTVFRMDISGDVGLPTSSKVLLREAQVKIGPRDEVTFGLKLWMVGPCSFEIGPFLLQ